MSFKIKLKLDNDLFALAKRFVDEVALIRQAIEAKVFPQPVSITLNLPREGDPTMPFSYKADRADFDAFVTIGALDSEGDVIGDVQIPAGHTLTVVSDNPSALSATQDPLNPKRVSYHVGSPNPDSTPAAVTVTATLTKDDDGSIVLTASDSGDVTVGDAVSFTALGIGLPTS